MKRSQEPGTKTNGQGQIAAALRGSARVLMADLDFVERTRIYLGKCRELVGADAAVVALLGAAGDDLEVALVDPEARTLELSPELPPSVRRLSADAIGGRPAFDNALSKSRTRKGSITGRSGRFQPKSALLAPIIVEGEVIGLLGLFDKAVGFTEAGCRLAGVLTDLASVAMAGARAVNGLERNRRHLEAEVAEGAVLLQQAEQNFRTLVENLPDMIARFDSNLRHLYISPAVELVTGRPPAQFTGRTNREAGMPGEFCERLDTALRSVFASGRPGQIELELSAPEGDRHFDCRLVPELEPGNGIVSVLSVARDVTDRWLAHQAEREARAVAESLREATIALSRSLDRDSVMSTLLERLRGMVPFDRASVMLMEEPTRVSVRAIFDGELVVPLTPEVRSVFDPADHPIVQSVLSTGSVVLIPDLRVRPDWGLSVGGDEEACWMGVPLFARGDVAGLFALSRWEADSFTPDHVRLAEAMSSQASVAVENAILFEQMQASSARMQNLSRRLVDVQETERRRIARELHDEAGQALASLRYGLRLLEREIDNGGTVNGRVAELMQRTDAVIESLHRLAKDLRPVSLDHLGLEVALQQFARSAAAEFGLPVRYKSRNFNERRLPSAVETALYRVVQEAVANVVHHAKASRIDVLLEHRGDRVMVMVEDDGVGFEPCLVDAEHHFGLLGIKERAEALSGTMTVESSAGLGTTVVVEVANADPYSDR